MIKNVRCITSYLKPLTKIDSIMVISREFMMYLPVIVIQLMTTCIKNILNKDKRYKYYNLNLRRNQGLLKKYQNDHYDFTTSVKTFSLIRKSKTQKLLHQGIQKKRNPYKSYFKKSRSEVVVEKMLLHDNQN